MHYIYVIEIIQEISFLRKPFLLNHKKCFNTDHCVFRKEQIKGYLNMNLKKVLQMLIICELATKLPQNLIFL